MPNRLENTIGRAQRVGGLGMGVMAVVVVLGQWSEAVDLIRVGANTVRSEFTNEVEYERLGRLKVGNSLEFAKSVVGEPEVLRNLDDGSVASYFFDRKYLLTLVERRQQVEAILVYALVDDFELRVLGERELLVAPLDAFPEPLEYIVGFSRTGAYYIESIPMGQAGMALERYVGIVDLIGTTHRAEIRALDRARTSGDPDRDALATLRAKATPNFYAEGHIDFATMERALLTPTELGYYLGR